VGCLGEGTDVRLVGMLPKGGRGGEVAMVVAIGVSAPNERGSEITPAK